MRADRSETKTLDVQSRVVGTHEPVLVAETLGLLALQPGMRVVDATVGAGGLAEAILERIGKDGLLIGIDRDPAMIELSRSRFRGDHRAALFQAAFSDLAQVIERSGTDLVDALVLDLGLNSIQLGDPARGFSFKAEGPLDMRYDPSQEVTAEQLINQVEELALADLIYRYGGERRSRRIARAIVRERRREKIRDTARLARLIERAAGARGRIHPATRTFQALRIAVNEELSELETALVQAEKVLRVGGRVVVISFHSLEDKIVKEYFREGERRGSWQRLTKKPVRPSAREERGNPRSRSARLRAARWMGDTREGEEKK